MEQNPKVARLRDPSGPEAHEASGITSEEVSGYPRGEGLQQGPDRGVLEPVPREQHPYGGYYKNQDRRLA